MTPGYTRCAVCKRHASGRLVLVVDLDTDNGSVVCTDAYCLEVAAGRHPNRRIRPYGKVKCVPECTHGPI